MSDPLHDFDFLEGSWNVSHHRLKERLAGCTDWEDFEGTCAMRRLMDGAANIDDNLLHIPSGTYRGVGLRAYDAKERVWRIWWLDSRTPAGIDVPVKGGFKDGTGTFLADDTLRGKPIKVRFTWSRITPTTAHWEQAFSPDGGASWETNWTMEFSRLA